MVQTGFLLRKVFTHFRAEKECLLLAFVAGMTKIRLMNLTTSERSDHDSSRLTKNSLVLER